MAKVRIKGLTTALRNVRTRLTRAKASKTLNNDIGEFTVDRIRASARSGKNERTGKKLPKLSKSYLDMRLGIVTFRKGQQGQTYPSPQPDPRLKKVDKQFFEPTRTSSNVTFTGQLLKALGFKIEKDSLFILFVKETRSDGPTNSKVYDHLITINSGYEFIGLGKAGIKRVTKLVLDEFRRQIRRN